jgi:hypothetical protein
VPNNNAEEDDIPDQALSGTRLTAEVIYRITHVLNHSVIVQYTKLVY